ncbi:hypothetical protein QQF64_031017 [Cirrhinus molitorella]|uniref:Ig-like domain-containing protein n=1 Tax=Cirrhinus molitorella TaxID=172907 RepID=A0ABR3N5C4_9TELE
MGSSALPLILLLMSLIHTGLTQGFPTPTLTVTPNRPVFTGETVNLVCLIEYSGWTYQWFKAATYHSESQMPYHYTVNENTLTIRGAAVSDEGQYQCRGQYGGSYSSRSNSVSLIVKERPKPVVHVDPDENVFIGEMVTLTCDIQGTQDWQYNWYKDQNYIVGQAQKYIISSVDWSHRGVYSCGGTQSKAPTYSQRSDGVTLTVSDKPQLTLTVNPQSPVFTGDTVTLSCDVRHLTVWTIYWRKDSNPEYTDAATKTIKSVSVSDGGRYWCRAHGYYDSYFSNRVKIIVKKRHKPVVHVDPDRSVFSGETVTLTCDIQQFCATVR